MRSLLTPLATNTDLLVRLLLALIVVSLAIAWWQARTNRRAEERALRRQSRARLGLDRPRPPLIDEITPDMARVLTRFPAAQG